MRRLAAKLGFVHRTLWQRNQAYCWAALLGPPPVFGGALAMLAWLVFQQIAPHVSPLGEDAPWARWTRPVPQEGQPFVEPPSAALPATDVSGHFQGFQPGWLGTIRPMSVDATMDTNVVGSVLGHFTLDQPTIPLTRILDAGPPTGLFVGETSAFFVVQTPGVYAFSVRLTRSSDQSANCVMRLGSAKHRMVRNVNLNINGQTILNYPPTEFRLEPGLFLLDVVAGCWRGDRAVGPGDATVLVRHPGAQSLQPVAAYEIIRQVPRATNASGP